MTNACHKVLQTPEIVSEIFGQLSPGSPDTAPGLHQERASERRITRKSLARLARVCRAFTDPALDVLWRVLEDLVNLLFILPSFAYGGVRVESDTDSDSDDYIEAESYALSRDISDGEWARFQAYARRVRELYTVAKTTYRSHHGTVRISESVWIFLARRLSPGQGLLPCLRRLESLDVSPANAGCILLLSPSLRHLSITISRRSATNNTILSIVRNTTLPYLTSLRTNRLFHFNTVGGDTCGRYSYLSHLQHLELGQHVVVDAGLLEALSTSPNLRKLTCRIGTWRPDGSRLPPNSFSALRDLDIEGVITDLGCFLQAASLRLDVLALRVTYWEYDDATASAAPGIQSAHSALCAVTHSTAGLSISIPDDCPPVSTILEPALAFHWLTTITITFTGETISGLVVSDADLGLFASAWPHLVEFRIFQSQVPLHYGLHRTEGPRARTLLLFAEQHPRLVRLALPYLRLGGDAIPGVDEVPVLNHGLRYLFVHFVEFVDSQRRRELALFIDRLFPNIVLDDLAEDDLMEPQYGAGWSDIKDLLVMLREGRRQALSAIHQSV